MPESVLRLWREFAECAIAPDACLINFYDAQARMGPHQDRDETDFSAPIVSFRLGTPAAFVMAATRAASPSASIRLDSGDVLVFGGPARIMFHGVDSILPGTSTLLSPPGRINLTLRRAGRAPHDEERLPQVICLARRPWASTLRRLSALSTCLDSTVESALRR